MLCEVAGVLYTKLCAQLRDESGLASAGHILHLNAFIAAVSEWAMPHVWCACGSRPLGMRKLGYQ